VAKGEYEAFLERRYFASLDGLRALSVLAVIWQHTARGSGISGQGHYGVDCFFAISGFLITSLLLREWMRRGQVDLRAFWMRRALRIFPVYYAMLGLYVVLVLTTRLGTAAGDQFLHNLPAFATYTSDWFVSLDQGPKVTFYFAWSLATEEQFYLVWAPILFLALSFTRRGFLVAGAGIVLAAVVDLVATLIWHSDALPHTILASIAMPICIGSLLALLLHTRRGWRILAPILRSPAAMAAAIVALAVSLVADLDKELIGALMGVLVAACCVREDHFLQRPLAWRPLAYIGIVSYGIYLMHMLAANVARPLIHVEHGPLLFVCTVPIAAALASISYRFFETPILRLKRRFERVPKPTDQRLAVGEPYHADGRPVI
jgi:peptidoglycan/LPS O-acetylase OafA/YrhL